MPIAYLPAISSDSMRSAGTVPGIFRTRIARMTSPAFPKSTETGDAAIKLAYGKVVHLEGARNYGADHN